MCTCTITVQSISCTQTPALQTKPPLISDDPAGLHPGRLRSGELSDRRAAPPHPAFPGPLPAAPRLGAGLGGHAVPGGAPEPAGLWPRLALHEGRGVLSAAAPDGGGEDRGMVPGDGEGGRGERAAGGG